MLDESVSLIDDVVDLLLVKELSKVFLFLLDKLLKLSADVIKCLVVEDVDSIRHLLLNRHEGSQQLMLVCLTVGLQVE